MLKSGCVALALGLAAVPVHAQVAPPTAPDAATQAQVGIGRFAEPWEQALLPAIAEALTVAESKDRLAKLDAVLAKLDQPSRLRGIVQSIRGVSLMEEYRQPEALAAAEEALRLAPGVPQVKFYAVYAMTFAGAPQRAADIWLALSREYPDLAGQMGGYILDTLRERLRDIGDRKRGDAVSARIAEIGVVEHSAPRASDSALAQIRQRMDDGKVAEAGALVPGVVVTRDLAQLYLDRRYEKLWPAIARWGGDDLARSQKLYLETLRRDWRAGGTLESATDFARALNEARGYSAVTQLFLPLLAPEVLKIDTLGVEFLTPPVARALMGQGRGEEAIALLKRVDATFTKDSAQKMNFSGNLAKDYLALGRFAEAATVADAWLRSAQRKGSEINRAALIGVQAIRACALIRGGKATQASGDVADVLMSRGGLPDPAMDIYACSDDFAGGKALAIESLNDENRRGWALRWLQPGSPELPYAESRRADLFQKRIAADPEVRAAAEKVGRILPFSLTERLPADFDPAAPADLYAPEQDAPPIS
ncbi:hypothetical protein P6144_00055 [Sphingomonas sp. HITSZ_GF]|uniref:hypothetical protein n=1 Tax=Sphingomonas sp. HITSZ_GF TaxID=3037247 RepID=UPI00240D1F5F|nr:hypothetical protein [Sphingomonas sp. HITSZ_GF]MDG2532029.1 hypothetical protein [Sphingomonas sp. HITSZ_GF]